MCSLGKMEGTHTIKRGMLYKNNFSHQTMQVSLM